MFLTHTHTYRITYIWQRKKYEHNLEKKLPWRISVCFYMKRFISTLSIYILKMNLNCRPKKHISNTYRLRRLKQFPQRMCWMQEHVLNKIKHIHTTHTYIWIEHKQSGGQFCTHFENSMESFHKITIDIIKLNDIDC